MEKVFKLPVTILRGGTSKVAIIKKSDRPDADVDYTFAQVSVDKPLVSYKGNCGNISSGVGPFAIEKGLVEPEEGLTTVRIYNTNTDKIIEADVVTHDGCVEYDGGFAIAGVPGTAAPVKLKFVDPAGTLGQGLLPTGNAVDVLECGVDYSENGSVPVVRDTFGFRTANLLMEGVAMIRPYGHF